jgi:hypothetical protein
VYDVPLELLPDDVVLPDDVALPVVPVVEPVVEPVAELPLEPLPICAFARTKRSLPLVALLALPVVALVPLVPLPVVPVAPPIESARCKQPVTVTVLWLLLADG